MRALVALLLASLALAGCTETDAPAEIQEVTEPAPTFAEHNVSISGHMGQGVSTAGFVWIFPEGHDRWFPQTMDGVVTDVSLTMEWTPTGPTAESLTLAFGEMERDNGNEYSETYKTVTGTSPLSLELSGLDWDNHEYVVWAWFESSSTLYAGPAQPFSITGTVSTITA